MHRNNNIFSFKELRSFSPSEYQIRQYYILDNILYMHSPDWPQQTVQCDMIYLNVQKNQS